MDLTKTQKEKLNNILLYTMDKNKTKIKTNNEELIKKYIDKLQCEIEDSDEYLKMQQQLKNITKYEENAEKKGYNISVANNTIKIITESNKYYNDTLNTKLIKYIKKIEKNPKNIQKIKNNILEKIWKKPNQKFSTILNEIESTINKII